MADSPRLGVHLPLFAPFRTTAWDRAALITSQKCSSTQRLSKEGCPIPSYHPWHVGGHGSHYHPRNGCPNSVSRPHPQVDCSRSTHPLPQPNFAPIIEATRHGFPGTVAFGYIPPRCACTQYPQDAIKNCAVVVARTTYVRFLSWKQGLQPLPLWLCLRRLALEGEES